MKPVARWLPWLALALAPVASAEEGMWTYDRFPAGKVKAAYGFEPDAAWLDRARLSSARIAGGCSASFVSASGLIMTNHHCAHDCIAALSSSKKDYVKSGFLAASQAEELRCPTMEINQLEAITDVTSRIGDATKGKSGEAYAAALRAEKATIEKDCQTGATVRCEVVTLYQGGVYSLYKYKRFQDVRLVFAPELAMAFFGGDPDNFEFPRYDLDVSFVRVYEGGAPAATPTHLTWSKAGAAEGELVFVSGHPGSTRRLLTMAELDRERAWLASFWVPFLSEYRGHLLEFGRRSPEALRTSTEDRFSVENSLKALSGRLSALMDDAFMATKAAAEKALRESIRQTPELAATDTAWGEIAAVAAKARPFDLRYRLLERLPWGTLIPNARWLVRGAVERTKPTEERLEDYSERALPEIVQGLESTAAFHPDVEILHLTLWLTRLRADLGSDDPLVKRLLSQESPEALATRVVRGTKLGKAAERLRLWNGGQAAIDASKDPAILLYKALDPHARAIRKQVEDELNAVLNKAHERIAAARFATQGTGTYPDATFTLRLSYGAVSGWTDEAGKAVPAFTTFGGVFDLATGVEPYALPPTWLAAKKALDPKTPFNMVTTNDIIGGNSGSPVFNQKHEVVGLIFDGNLDSLAGAYGFDGRRNRAVAVHSSALLEALRTVYGAGRVADEITAP
jgi:hypothetical protein